MSVLSISSIYGANINVNTTANLNKTYFTYLVNFSNSDSYSYFSIEKPRDSSIIKAINLNNNRSLFYSSAGDFYIFKTKSTSGNSYLIRFESKVPSNEIKKNNLFKIYLNFNFPVQNLTFFLHLNFNYGSIVDIFPRNYLMNKKNIEWEIKNPKRDTLVMIDFSSLKQGISSSEKNNYNSIDKILNFIKSLPVIISIILLIFFIIVFYSYKKMVGSFANFKKEISKKQKSHIEGKNTEESNKEEKQKDEEITEETFDEFLSKYLTENEIEVVLVVKDREGLIQNDILSEVKGLTKSNLSKIITKLDSKQILKRIRVGKVNKIYLGTKLEKFREK